MQKTMIYLDEDTHVRLKYLALDGRVSMAELIRRAIELYLKAQPRRPAVRTGSKARKAVLR
jgi:predicted transcriptional regulator